MKYKNPKINLLWFVLCSIPRLFVYLHMRMSTLKQLWCVRGPLWECHSIQSGAFGLPYYCALIVCVFNVFESLAVWRHNKPKPSTGGDWWATCHDESCVQYSRLQCDIRVSPLLPPGFTYIGGVLRGQQLRTQCLETWTGKKKKR